MQRTDLPAAPEPGAVLRFHQRAGALAYNSPPAGA